MENTAWFKHEMVTANTLAIHVILAPTQFFLWSDICETEYLWVFKCCGFLLLFLKVLKSFKNILKPYLYKPRGILPKHFAATPEKKKQKKTQVSPNFLFNL